MIRAVQPIIPSWPMNTARAGQVEPDEKGAGPLTAYTGGKEAGR